MTYLSGRLLALLALPSLLVLGGCSNDLTCDSIDTRNAVLQSVADDHNNPLANYAAKNSDAKPIAADAKPQYLLGERIVTTSKNGKTLQCSGAISATVGDAKATKEIDFTVQKTKDGKISVSVVPFQF